MPRLWSRLSLVAMLLMLAALLAACADDEGAGDGDDTTTTSERATTTEAATSGRGEIALDGRVYSFEADTCRIDEGDVPTFEVEGTGSVDGSDFEVTVRRRASGDDARFIESAKLTLSGTDASASTNLFVADGFGEPRLNVEDSAIAGIMEFTSVGDAPAGPGEIEVTCES